MSDFRDFIPAHEDPGALGNGFTDFVPTPEPVKQAPVIAPVEAPVEETVETPVAEPVEIVEPETLVAPVEKGKGGK